jgi:hypothetical protein
MKHEMPSIAARISRSRSGVDIGSVVVVVIVRLRAGGRRSFCRALMEKLRGMKITALIYM